METQAKILIMVLINLTMGQAMEDLDIMKEMMAEMNERLAKTEAELVLTKDELAATKGELEVTKHDLAVTKVTLANAVIDLTEAHSITKDDLAITKEALMSKTDELERDVAILKAPPYIHACGSHYYELSASSGTIPYTSLLYSSTNTEGGGLDITTGVFTAPWGGSYTVSWDTRAYLQHGEWVNIYLQKNMVSIEDSRHISRYNGDGLVGEQGKLLPILLT